MTRYSIKDSEVLQVQCSATRSGRQAVTTVVSVSGYYVSIHMCLAMPAICNDVIGVFPTRTFKLRHPVFFISSRKMMDSDPPIDTSNPEVREYLSLIRYYMTYNHELELMSLRPVYKCSPHYHY
jgi:hypothetical protein